MVDASAIRDRLSAPDLPELLHLLGLRAEDVADTLAARDAALADPATLARVTDGARRLAARLGDVTMERAGAVWAPSAPGTPEGHAEGVAALLALVATVPEVRALHQARGVSDAISWRSLGDLGQQVHVHRLALGTFGLHTHPWLVNAWVGGLYWLGRLQYTLRRRGEGVVLSCHIPRTGPLRPEDVDASFARAAEFFPAHFPDLPAVALHCDSWLLDPRLAQVLPPDSNLARFQRRWRLDEHATEADDSVLFFVFDRRGSVDLDALPQDSTLRRAVVAHLRAGGHWYSREGTVPLPEPAAGPGPAPRAHRVASDPETIVQEFHERYAMPIDGGPPSADRERVHMRLALVVEETAELVAAVYGPQAGAAMEAAFTRAVALDDGTRDTLATADALGDLVYVVYGMAIECGIPLPEVLAAIHRSNLTKLGSDGAPVLREDGKILKGPHYSPPAIADVLRRHGWHG